jgi:hypothetical protein
VDGTGLGFCLMAGFGTSSVGSSGYVKRVN